MWALPIAHLLHIPPAQLGELPHDMFLSAIEFVKEYNKASDAAAASAKG